MSAVLLKVALLSGTWFPDQLVLVNKLVLELPSQVELVDAEKVLFFRSLMTKWIFLGHGFIVLEQFFYEFQWFEYVLRMFLLKEAVFQRFKASSCLVFFVWTKFQADF